MALCGIIDVEQKKNGMRIIIYGIGAIGGTLAAALTLAGNEVVGIARGAQLDAIRKNGLRFKTPHLDRVVQFTCVSSPTEVDINAEDIIIVCVKSHDSVAVFQELRKAGVESQPIFCAQNGIANEREAQRYFSDVHGVTVMMPSMFLHPGEVAVFGEPNLGIFDIGCAPSGINDADNVLADLLISANFAAYTSQDIMMSKRSKLLLNLGNIVQAALGLGVNSGDLISRLRSEAEAVYRAQELKWHDVNKPDSTRAELMRVAEISGIERVGGSTLQSLLRNSSSLETDFLNGEIVMLGRLAGIKTPLNTAMTRLGVKVLQDRIAPGSMSLDNINKCCEKAIER